MNHPTCGIDGCERRTRTAGMTLCQMHYRRVQRHGSPGPPGPMKVTRYNNESCRVDECDRLAVSQSYCFLHFKRVQRHGEPGPAEPLFTPGQNDGIDDEGYRRIRVNGRRVKEHRHVMELKLGRPLVPGENVHHINGVRHDNRPENLELWTTSQTSGQRVKDKLAWAREIIDRYQPLEDAGLI